MTRRQAVVMTALWVAALIGWFWRVIAQRWPDLSGPTAAVSLCAVVWLGRWMLDAVERPDKD